MRLKVFLSLGLILVSLIFAVHVFALGSPEDQGEDIFTLGEVVMSAPLGGIEGAETVHEITAEDLKKSNARTLDEGLVLMSDVNVRVGNEGVPRIDIRGFRTRHVLLLLDGIPMNSAFDQQFDPSTIPVENIAKIKVTTGASSVLYGQGGIGGVINIITKKGRKGLIGMVGYDAGDGTPYLAFTVNYVQGGYGKPASAIDNTFDPYAPPPRYGRVDDYIGITLQLAAAHSVSKDLNIRSMIYYNQMDQDNNQYDDENYDSFDDPFVAGSFKIRNKVFNIAGTLQNLNFQPRMSRLCADSAFVARLTSAE